MQKELKVLKEVLESNFYIEYKGKINEDKEIKIKSDNKITLAFAYISLKNRIEKELKSSNIDLEKMERIYNGLVIGTLMDI